MYSHANRSHTHDKDPVVPCSVDYGNNKITHHALKVSVFITLKVVYSFGLVQFNRRFKHAKIQKHRRNIVQENSKTNVKVPLLVNALYARLIQVMHVTSLKKYLFKQYFDQ